MKRSICMVSGFSIEMFLMSIGWYSGNFKYLLILMCLDFLTGIMVAVVHKNSRKSEHGGLSSTACYAGLVKKMSMLFMILTASACDGILNTENNIIRECVIMSLIVNDLISLIENFMLIGIPVPDIFKKCIDILMEDNK